ncbi:MAG: J domain-containing protein [Spirochaetaceae bacterium]|nr:J domain-containing protein [Spirochaetaceae bacterium]
MENHYEILGIREDASGAEIKRAFREKAKRLHPDIARTADAGAMRRLLVAYETLSNRDRRFEYDRIFQYAKQHDSWDYRTYLKERSDDPEYQAKRIFFELLHFEEDSAIKVWQESGGIDFPLWKFLDREDWMDCAFLLAEELARQGFAHEAFLILVSLLREEQEKPYFRHFTLDVELLLKEVVRLKLRRTVDDETWMDCLRAMLRLGFDAKTEAFYLKSLAEALFKTGDKESAREAFERAKTRDRKITLCKSARVGLGL